VLAVYLFFSPMTSTAADMHFFSTNLQPPPEGMYLCPDQNNPYFAIYAPGIMIKNWCNRLFSASVSPPLSGSPITHSFSAKAEFEISFDGGSSWQPAEANASETMQIAYQAYDGNDGSSVYSAQIIQLDISGGGLPMCVQIRESPTLASSGLTRIKPIAGGYQISSFFDIYTEVSTDCGSSWYPTFQPGHVELKVDPQLIPAMSAASQHLPSPVSQDVSTGSPWQSYASGIMLKNVKHKLFSAWWVPPALGGTQTHTFDAHLDFLFSSDGGMVYSLVRAPATMTVKISNIREFQGRSTYETEVTLLDIGGGDLPAGVQIRESPTKASQGGVSMIAGGGGGGGGGAAISSFFDIFTEVSTDGGSSWQPASSGPGHLEAQAISEEELYASPDMPSLYGEYYCPEPYAASFANGIVLANLFVWRPTAAIPPPPPGSTTSHTFGAETKMLVSYDGGLTFGRALAPITATWQITHRLGGDGVTEYYDIEMTQLSISGGGLPAGVQIRESPTKASSGRTSERSVGGGGGGYYIDSFFDIFTEVSTDGGMSWLPTISGSATILLRHKSCNWCSNLNKTGLTDMVDYAILAENWLWTESPGDALNIADITCDGKVDLYDLREFVSHWLQASCP
jgi:hypothetical protein